MQDFTQLVVWRKAHVTVSIYKITTNIPSEEKFGLISHDSCVPLLGQHSLAPDGDAGSDL